MKDYDVELTDGSDITVGGEHIRVNDAVLAFYDEDGVLLEAYAPTAWTSVSLVVEDDDA